MELQQSAPKPSEYRLPEADRQAILAGSDFHARTLEIEAQRLRFIEVNGDPFGQKKSPNSINSA